MFSPNAPLATLAPSALNPSIFSWDSRLTWRCHAPACASPTMPQLACSSICGASVFWIPLVSLVQTAMTLPMLHPFRSAAPVCHSRCARCNILLPAAAALRRAGDCRHRRIIARGFCRMQGGLAHGARALQACSRRVRPARASSGALRLPAFACISHLPLCALCARGCARWRCSAIMSTQADKAAALRANTWRSRFPARTARHQTAGLTSRSF